LIRAAEGSVALFFRIIPRRYRFDLALWLARVGPPLFRRTTAYREQQRLNYLTPREIALHLILNALTKNGAGFDPRFVIDGYEDFQQAYQTRRGVLITGHHAALTQLLVRRFHDDGLDPIVITPDQRMRAAGSSKAVRTIQPSATTLVKVRTRFRRGELICAMPDRAEHDSRRTVEFSTAAGRLIIAPALIELAARCGAEVLFTEVRLADRHLAVTIVPPACERSDAQALISEFVSFVRTRTGGSSPTADRMPFAKPTINNLSPSRLSNRG